MTIIPSVCILTAGLGTLMGEEYSCINKSLLPYGPKAMISNIIDQFDKKTQFIIAVGHKAQQVKNYLKIAHPNSKFKFILIKNYNKAGSGPGYSLFCCKKYLQQPFYFIACDTLYTPHNKLNLKNNYVGVSLVSKSERINYCNLEIKKGFVTDIKDKVLCNDNYMAFTGYLYVYNYDIFWKGISSKRLISGERQISNGLLSLLNKSKIKIINGDWIDIGSNQKYKNELQKINSYDFGKLNEFIYFVNKKVIKFFSDKSIIKNRIYKSTLNKDAFPKILDKHDQFYSYNLINGKTLYQSNNVVVFKNFLEWLDKKFWVKVIVNKKKFQKICFNFYHEKTYERFSQFKKKYPKFINPKFINGEKVMSIDKLLHKIDWIELSNGLPTFIHGDLQFDNVLFNEKKNRFYLLDWRHDFAGEIKYGDIYYDIAKLMGGLILNYDYIKMNLLNFDQNKNIVHIDFASRFVGKKYIEILEDFVKKKNLDLDKIMTLVGIIFLNMAPLHHPPFDKGLYCLSNLFLSKLFFLKK